LALLDNIWNGVQDWLGVPAQAAAEFSIRKDRGTADWQSCSDGALDQVLAHLEDDDYRDGSG
jgi:hypothetical protein